MKVKYFEDSDTALVEFQSKEIQETREVSENIYIDLDSEGNLVSMTIEHAKDKASIHEVAFERMASQAS
jgi:uncharacterized protein YuzE